MNLWINLYSVTNSSNLIACMHGLQREESREPKKSRQSSIYIPISKYSGKYGLPAPLFVFFPRIQRLVEAGIVEQIKRQTFDIDLSKCSSESFETERVKLRVRSKYINNLSKIKPMTFSLFSLEWFDLLNT